VRGCFLAIVAAALVVAAGGCSLVQKPSAAITGVKMQGASFSEATMLFDVQVDNPYTAALPLTNLDYVLSSAGQTFLTGKSDVQGTIPAGGSKVISVPVRINYLDLVNLVQGARPGVSIPYKADLGLSVTAPLVGDMRVPVSREGELTIPSTSTMLDRVRDLVR
jgi:LEA14-like dessication related protein